MKPLHEVLKHRTPDIAITKLLVITNLLVFIAMLIDGAGFWHSPNAVQLSWGANFGPATQDGEWWRLGSAMFLHFGLLHLTLNLWSLWDAGQLVERMYGHFRFAAIYLLSGLSGNLLSLVAQGNVAVSGGASGAIFGIYGALITFLWRERSAIAPHEFRWLFWGAMIFAAISLAFGFMVPGIDNSAHIGGFVTGILLSIVFASSINAKALPVKASIASASILIISITLLILNIPAAKYRWSEELLLRKKIEEFSYQDQEINRSWLEIMHEGKQDNMSFDGLANHIDSAISERYEDSFEKLSQLPSNPALPSATKLENILNYVKQKKTESQAIANELRNKDSSNINQPK